MSELLQKFLEAVRRKNPLIHNITNYVSVNDCANVLIATGASPIMADDINEVIEITNLCHGLNLNIGTLNTRIIETMHVAGQVAGEDKHPIVLDPVGVGASLLRRQTAFNLMRAVPLSVIKCNVSELRILTRDTTETYGVDANKGDELNRHNLPLILSLAKRLARKYKCVVVVTGIKDLITDGAMSYLCHNGNSLMSKVSGTGCMLSALITAYIAATPEDTIRAALAATCAWSIAGEIAAERMGDLDGNASYRNYLIDALYNLSGTELQRRANYEIII